MKLFKLFLLSDEKLKRRYITFLIVLSNVRGPHPVLQQLLTVANYQTLKVTFLSVEGSVFVLSNNLEICCVVCLKAN